jgi:hypothetical protein
MLFQLFTEIFYFVGFFFIVFQIKNFTNPVNVLFKEVLRSIYYEDKTNEIAKKLYFLTIGPDSLYGIWIIIGVWSSNWILFVILFILSLVSHSALNVKKVKGKDLHNYIFVNTLLNFIVLLLILKSHYFHL